MATSVSFNGSTYSIPSLGERSYGTNVSNFLIAVAGNALSKAGGNFTLTAEANFGATYGLVAKYLKSASSNISTTGVIRFANNEGLAWRNAANNADIALKVNASDALEYNGVVVGTQGLAATDSPTFAGLTLTSFSGVVKASAGVLSASALVNADVDAAAAIADTKLATIATAGKVSNSATTAASANTASAIVARDGSGNFSAGTITANLTGNASGTAANVTGTVAIANGGTGETTANDALNALLPSQTTNGGKVLATDGTDTEWVSVATTATATASADGLLSAAGYRHLSNNYGTIDSNDSNRTVANTDDHYRVYTGFTASRDVTLPTTGVTAGESFKLENTTAFDMVVKASGGNALTIANSANMDATVRSGYVILRAKQATPTTPAHWQVVEVYDVYIHSTTVTAAGSGGGTTGAKDIPLIRHNKIAIAALPNPGVVLSSSPNTTNTVFTDTATPTRFWAAYEASVAIGSATINSATATAFVYASTAGTFNYLNNNLAAAWTHAAGAGFNTSVVGLSWITN